MEKALFIILSSVLHGVFSHPQCLDSMPPFKPTARFSMCAEYETFGCCDGAMENALIRKWVQLRSNMSQDNACEFYVRRLLCQKCSPYAAHLYNVEDGAQARNIPSLCPGYCFSMVSSCPSVVGLFTSDQKLLDLVQKGYYHRFCTEIAPPDPDYCYPDLKTNPSLANNLGTVRFYQKTGSCIPVCVEEVANRLFSPLSAKHANDGTQRLFIVEQRGMIWIYLPDRSRLDPAFLDLSDIVLANERRYDERGLLDIAFHPDYKVNGKFYLYYSYAMEGSHYVKISEMMVSGIDMNRANVTTERTLITIRQPAANHNGGQLLFLDGMLFIFTGDGGKSGDPFGLHGNGQNKGVLLGKVLRIDVDSRGENNLRPYGIPTDNPFVGDSRYLPEIYALGVRNMWRCSVDRGDATGKNKGRIICGDVGQNRFEEINIIVKGGNYGWRAYEGYSCFDKKLCNNDFVQNYVRPIHAYGHSVGKSVTGGYVYRGCQNPNLRGKYIFGDFMNGKLFTLSEELNGGWRRQSICLADSSVCKNGGLKSTYAQHILSFGEDEAGELYMLSTTKALPGHRGGSVYKLVDPSRRGDPSTCVNAVKDTVLQSWTRITPYMGEPVENVTVRLVSGDSINRGRVEVHYDGEWGTICDDSWDLKDAHVICRMLGFEGALEAFGLARFGRGVGPIWLDEVQCGGQENSIAACDHSAWGDHNCIHSEDASVSCRPKGHTEKVE